MNEVRTANPVMGLDRVEPQVLGRAPAPFLDFSSLRLLKLCDGTLTVNSDLNAA